MSPIAPPSNRTTTTLRHDAATNRNQPSPPLRPEDEWQHPIPQTGAALRLCSSTRWPGNGKAIRGRERHVQPRGSSGEEWRMEHQGAGAGGNGRNGEASRGITPARSGRESGNRAVTDTHRERDCTLFRQKCTNTWPQREAGRDIRWDRIHYSCPFPDGSVRRR